MRICPTWLGNDSFVLPSWSDTIYRWLMLCSDYNNLDGPQIVSAQELRGACYASQYNLLQQGHIIPNLCWSHWYCLHQIKITRPTLNKIASPSSKQMSSLSDLPCTLCQGTLLSPLACIHAITPLSYPASLHGDNPAWHGVTWYQFVWWCGSYINVE